MQVCKILRSIPSAAESFYPRTPLWMRYGSRRFVSSINYSRSMHRLGSSLCRQTRCQTIPVHSSLTGREYTLCVKAFTKMLSSSSGSHFRPITPSRCPLFTFRHNYSILWSTLWRGSWSLIATSAIGNSARIGSYRSSSMLRRFSIWRSTTAWTGKMSTPSTSRPSLFTHQTLISLLTDASSAYRSQSMISSCRKRPS